MKQMGALHSQSKSTWMRLSACEMTHTIIAFLRSADCSAQVKANMPCDSSMNTSTRSWARSHQRAPVSLSVRYRIQA